jgi:hypothetical protein
MNAAAHHGGTEPRRKALGSVVRNVVALITLWAMPAFSQGCAMCYASAKGASTDSQRALTRAVLVLLLPTLTLIGGMVGLVYKFRNSNQE